MVQLTIGLNSDEELVAALTRLQYDVAELAKDGNYLQKLQQHQNQEALQQQVAEGFQKLAEQAERINALATQLELEIFQFKDIAVKANQAYHILQQPPDLKSGSGKFKLKPLNLWEVHYSKIPTVVRHKAGFILTATTIDLFKAEQESDFQKHVTAAQRRREALECWLAAKKSPQLKL